MLRIFGGGNVFVLALLPIFIAIFQLFNFQFQYYTLFNTIDLGIWGKYEGINAFFGSLLTGSIITVNAIIINQLFNKNGFFVKSTFLPALLYVTVMSFNHSFYEMNGIVVAHFMFILGIYQLFRLDQNEDGKAIIFKASFCFGLGATLHTPLSTILPVLWLMTWVIRPFVVREFLLSIVGFCLPLVYGASFLYIKHIDIWVNPLKNLTNYHEKEIIFQVSSIALGLLFLMSVVSIQRKMANSTIRLKKLIRIMWYLVIYTLCLGFLNFALNRQNEWFSYVAIPFSFFLPFAIQQKSINFLASIGFYVILAISIAKFLVF